MGDTRRSDREVILAAHADCTTDPGTFADSDVATLVYRAHAGHGPRCLQGLAADAYISEALDD